MKQNPKGRSYYFEGLIALLLCAMGLYVGTFSYLSRYGHPAGSRWDSEGYYFADPMTKAGEDQHLLLCHVYWPLIEVDYRLVTGRRPGATLTQVLTCVDDDDDLFITR